MKAHLMILWAFAYQTFASITAISPSVRESVDKDELLDLDMDFSASIEFTGPVTPGGEDVTLSGSAEEIYNQILKINPSYTPWDFPEYAEDLRAKGFVPGDLDNITLSSKLPSLRTSPAQQANGLVARAATFNCNKGRYVGNVWTQCSEGLGYLWKLGRSRCKAQAKSCARVSCSHNCGMFYCNKLSKGTSAACGDIADDIVDIIYECLADLDPWVTPANGRKSWSDHFVELSGQSC